MKVVVESSAVPLTGLPLGGPVEVPEGACVRVLLRRGGVDGNELYLLPAVNGEIANLDRVLRDGDRIRFFWLSAGG